MVRRAAAVHDFWKLLLLAAVLHPLFSQRVKIGCYILQLRIAVYTSRQGMLPRKAYSYLVYVCVPPFFLPVDIQHNQPVSVLIGILQS